MKQTDPIPVTIGFLFQCRNRKKKTSEQIYIYKLGYNLSNEHMEGTEIECGSAEAVINLVKPAL